MTSSAHNGYASRRHIIRFEDGDPENPNNWGRVSCCVRKGTDTKLMSNAVEEDLRPYCRHYEW